MATDYYELLEVPRDANPDTIKRAYRQQALKYHPDRNPGNRDAEERFKEISNAFQVLSDPEKRELYDRYGPDGPNHAGFGGGFTNVQDIFSSFGDIFGDIFGLGGFGRRRGGRPIARGGDIDTKVTLTFREAVEGCRKDLKIDRHARCQRCDGRRAAPGTSSSPCPTCHGKGQVMHSQGFFMISTTCPACRGEGVMIQTPCPACKGAGLEIASDTLTVTIPAGVDSGQQLRVSGKGDLPPDTAGVPGDLYVVLDVQEDERLHREGADLLVEVRLSYPLAVLGGKTNVPTLEGERELTVKPGTKAGDVLVFRGAGVPHLNGHGRGDQVVRFDIAVPSQLSPRARELLKDLAQELGDEFPPEKVGLLNKLRGKNQRRK
jgi:molecular chaperone DnaJ